MLAGRCLIIDKPKQRPSGALLHLERTSALHYQPRLQPRIIIARACHLGDRFSAQAHHAVLRIGNWTLAGVASRPMMQPSSLTITLQSGVHCEQRAVAIVVQIVSGASIGYLRCCLHCSRLLCPRLPRMDPRMCLDMQR